MKSKKKIAPSRAPQKSRLRESVTPSVPQLTREISVMAWIEDPFGKVLLVKQTAGKRAWTFPGGKVRAGEPLLEGLKRELYEEVRLTVDIATPIDIFDRSEKSNLTVLFRVILHPRSRPIVRKGEIEEFAFRRAAPRLSTPSLRYFWARAQKTFEPLALF